MLNLTLLGKLLEMLAWQNLVFRFRVTVLLKAHFVWINHKNWHTEFFVRPKNNTRLSLPTFLGLLSHQQILNIQSIEYTKYIRIFQKQSHGTVLDILVGILLTLFNSDWQKHEDNTNPER